MIPAPLRILALIVLLPIAALGFGVGIFWLLAAGGNSLLDGGLLSLGSGAGGICGCVGLIRIRMAGQENRDGNIRLNETLIVIGELTAIAVFVLLLAIAIAEASSGYLVTNIPGWGILLALAVLIVDGVDRLACCDALQLAFLIPSLALVTVALLVLHDVPGIL